MSYKYVNSILLAGCISLSLYSGEKELKQKGATPYSVTYSLPLQKLLREAFKNSSNCSNVDVARIGIMSRLRDAGILNKEIDVTFYLNLDLEFKPLLAQLLQLQEQRDKDATLELTVTVERMQVVPKRVTASRARRNSLS